MCMSCLPSKCLKLSRALIVKRECQGLNAQPGVTVTLRVDAGPPPARLQHIAEQAAQSGDLRSMHPADLASHARAQWDELRVWDPGD